MPLSRERASGVSNLSRCAQVLLKRQVLIVTTWPPQQVRDVPSVDMRRGRTVGLRQPYQRPAFQPSAANVCWAARSHRRLVASARVPQGQHFDGTSRRIQDSIVQTVFDAAEEDPPDSGQLGASRHRTQFRSRGEPLQRALEFFAKCLGGLGAILSPPAPSCFGLLGCPAREPNGNGWVHSDF